MVFQYLFWKSQKSEERSETGIDFEILDCHLIRKREKKMQEIKNPKNPMVFPILSEVDKSFSVPEHTVYVTVGCIVHARKT